MVMIFWRDSLFRDNYFNQQSVMDHHCLHTDFLNDLKKSINEKASHVAALKAEQLALRNQVADIRKTCEQLASKLDEKVLNESDKEQFSKILRDSLAEEKIIAENLNACEKNLWVALGEFTSLQSTKLHIEVMHGIKLNF